MTEPIDLIILAGGQARRLGGREKGLIPIDGEPAVARLARRMLREGDHLIVSANRSLQAYRQLGATVVTDTRPDMGPLGGLQSCLPALRQHLQLIIPCDMPWLPGGLRDSLPASVPRNGISVLHDGHRRQPLCMALRARDWEEDLAGWLNSGGRSVLGWLEDKAVYECRLEPSEPRCFINLNSEEDFPH